MILSCGILRFLSFFLDIDGWKVDKRWFLGSQACRMTRRIRFFWMGTRIEQVERIENGFFLEDLRTH